MNRREMLIAAGTALTATAFPGLLKAKTVPWWQKELDNRPHWAPTIPEMVELCSYLDRRGVSFYIMTHPCVLLDIRTGYPFHKSVHSLRAEDANYMTRKYGAPVVARTRKLKRRTGESWEEIVHLFKDYEQRLGPCTFGIYNVSQTQCVLDPDDYCWDTRYLIRYAIHQRHLEPEKKLKARWSGEVWPEEMAAVRKWLETKVLFG